jgi:GPI mannosyltransferase 3
LHPVIIAAAYKLLEFINFDSTWTIVYIPRILQALLSAFADYRFYLWCNQKKWSLFIIISSWFWFYTGSRTLINTFETSLTTVALSIYPWNRGKGEEKMKKK